MNLLVIGYGNSLCGDDGLGPRAVELLAGRLSEYGTEVLACHQLTPELSERLAAAHLVVFIDAETGMTPGSVHCRTVWPTAARPVSIAHTLDPSALLAMTQSLYDACPSAVLFSVGVHCFDLGE